MADYVSRVDVTRNGVTRTLIDITDDTVDAASLLVGKTAHGRDGAAISGALSVVTYHVSASEPTSAQGSDGDIWLVTG